MAVHREIQRTCKTYGAGEIERRCRTINRQTGAWSTRIQTIEDTNMYANSDMYMCEDLHTHVPDQTTKSTKHIRQEQKHIQEGRKLKIERAAPHYHEIIIINLK